MLSTTSIVLEMKFSTLYIERKQTLGKCAHKSLANAKGNITKEVFHGIGSNWNDRLGFIVDPALSYE